MNYTGLYWIVPYTSNSMDPYLWNDYNVLCRTQGLIIEGTEKGLRSSTRMPIMWNDSNVLCSTRSDKRAGLNANSEPLALGQ